MGYSLPEPRAPSLSDGNRDQYGSVVRAGRMVYPGWYGGRAYREVYTTQVGRKAYREVYTTRVGREVYTLGTPCGIHPVHPRV